MKAGCCNRQCSRFQFWSSSLLQIYHTNPYYNFLYKHICNSLLIHTNTNNTVIIFSSTAAVLVVAIIACSGCCCTNKKRRTTRVQPKAEVWNGTRSLYPNALLYHLDDSIKCNEKKCGLQSGIKLNTGHFFYISLKGLQLCTIIFTNIVLRRVWSQRNQTTTQATYWYQRPLHYS